MNIPKPTLLCVLFFLPAVLPVCAQFSDTIPQIDSLSVVDTAGMEKPFMVWNRLPGAEGYIVFHWELQNNNWIWHGIDTTYSETDTSYLDLAGLPGSQSENYRIGELNSDYEGDFSGAFGIIHTTIHAAAEFDSCEGAIALEWNKYRGWQEEIIEYRIFTSENGGPFVYSASQMPDDTTWLFTGAIAYSEYCFLIRAVSEEGRTSTSNTVCVTADMPRPPAYINADQATVKNNETILISFHIDPQAETEEYRLLRRPAGQANYDTLHVFSGGNPGYVEYTDEEADLDMLWEYCLAAVNECGKTVCLSNVATNISLHSNAIDFLVHLVWNAYREWNGGVDRYVIFRSIGNGPFLEIGTTNRLNNTFTDDISGFRTQAVPGLFCYRITAIESAGNPYGINGESRSNISCIEMETDIRFPSAIVPNSDIPVNRVFKPVYTFFPREYYLVIYNRWNNKVFETTNPSEGWDGNPGGGATPQEGIYIYYCKIKNMNGDVVEKTGKVAVLFRK
ncbi:MAG: gliding motility-associated C-terminal domain-containing protein [Bacteroidales bacterium]